jgi:hypothetical protein
VRSSLFGLVIGLGIGWGFFAWGEPKCDEVFSPIASSSELTEKNRAEVGIELKREVEHLDQRVRTVTKEFANVRREHTKLLRQAYKTIEHNRKAGIRRNLGQLDEGKMLEQIQDKYTVVVRKEYRLRKLKLYRRRAKTALKKWEQNEQVEAE